MIEMQREQGTLGEIWEKERAGNGAGTKEGQKEKIQIFLKIARKYAKKWYNKRKLEY